MTSSSISIRRSSVQLSGLFAAAAAEGAFVPDMELDGVVGEGRSGDCAFTLVAHNPAAASQIEKGQIEKGKIRARIVKVNSRRELSAPLIPLDSVSIPIVAHCPRTATSSPTQIFIL